MRHTFVVSSDITADEHVRMQAAIQAFVDNSISKTCNFPEGATEEDVAKAYLLAWETGLQGADGLCHGQPPGGRAGDQGDQGQEEGSDAAPACQRPAMQRQWPIRQRRNVRQNG